MEDRRYPKGKKKNKAEKQICRGPRLLYRVQEKKKGGVILFKRGKRKLRGREEGGLNRGVKEQS